MTTALNLDRGGYDYQFVDTPSDMLLCKICHLPSKEPHLSVCCGHTFCKSCLDGLRQSKPNLSLPWSFPEASEVVSCPMCRSEDFDTVANKQNERAIKSLRVFCANKDKGCDWQGELNDIFGHLRNSDGCQFEEVKCSNDCGLLLQRQCIPSHIDNECPCREVHCHYCSLLGQHRFIEGEHISQCPKFPLPCPNNCGIDDIFREDMDVHKTTCPLEEVECPNYCGETLHRQSMDSHTETLCPRRKIDCQYCQLSGEHHLIEGQHKEECVKLPIRCPNECDTGDIPREDMEQHKQKCPLAVVKCEYYTMGCDVSMFRKDQHMHEKEKMEEHLLLTKSELFLAKSELMNIKADYETKTKELESEIQQNHTNIFDLKFMLEQSHAKVKSLESELQQNRALMNLFFGEWTMRLNTKAIQLSSGDQVLPVIVRMSEYAKKKENNVDWYSGPFYTHWKGYKIQLNVVPNGYDTVKGTQLSVYLYVMEGPYDNTLLWPLKGKFKVTLLNQAKDTNHHSVTHQINGVNRVHFWTDSSSKMMWYHPRFIKTTTLLSSEYLKSDSLFFEVSKV